MSLSFSTVQKFILHRMGPYQDKHLTSIFSRQAISKWEVGSAYPDIDRLVQISNLFDITLDSLIKGDDSLKKSIVITKNPKAQTNVWEFMSSTGWMMVIAIIYSITKMIIAVFG